MIVLTRRAQSRLRCSAGCWRLVLQRLVVLAEHIAAQETAKQGVRAGEDRNLMKMTMMQQGLSGLLLLLLLSSCVSGLESVVRKDYRYFANQRTWEEAQNFCRRSHYYTDLATIYTQSDTELMNMNWYFAWIDLHQSADFSTSLIFEWLWSDGQHNFMNHWDQGEPGDGESCAFISSHSNRLYGASCEKYLFFICQKGGKNNPRYSFIPQPKTWSEAQRYCRDQFHDLVTLKGNFNLDSDVQHSDFPVWTGLHKDGQTWKWSRGLSEYRKWASGEPGNNGDCVSISSFSKEMATQNCSARFPSVCFRDNLVLVKENKTWEEALEHCRALQYELVSVQPGTDHSYVMRKVMEANTEKVWAGLRFLAGSWLWVNKASMLYSGLPHCPLEEQHCGALSKSDSGSLETIDCLEKLNFLCYSTT